MLILASASPRRRDLLNQLGLEFEIQPADIDETGRPNERPPDFVRRLAREKAWAVAQRVGQAGRRFVLGSDTLVVLDGVPLGKPSDTDEAFEMLTRLTGRTHSVMTGVAVVDAWKETVIDQVVESRVQMREAQPEEIQAYVETGEGLDKAGAYALQGEGRRFITAVHGSESNVIGLPLDETSALLERVQREAQPPSGNAAGEA